MLPYISTRIADAISVKGIITVFKYSLPKTKDENNGEAHDFPELLYIDSGAYTMVVDGKEHELRTGDAIIYAPCAFHSSKSKTEANVFIMSFELESKSDIAFYNKVISLDLKQRETLKAVVHEALPCFTRRPKGTGFHGMTLNEGVSEYTLEKIKKQLEFFLLDIQKNGEEKLDKKYAEDIERVRKFCSENINKKLTLSDMANGGEMSISKLKLLFRENFGGALNFFNELKLDEAKRLIREGKLNFTEIADSLGFSSLHYFSRLFKKKIGLSPSEYQKKTISSKTE